MKTKQSQFQKIKVQVERLAHNLDVETYQLNGYKSTRFTMDEHLHENILILQGPDYKFGFATDTGEMKDICTVYFKKDNTVFHSTFKIQEFKIMMRVILKFKSEISVQDLRRVFNLVFSHDSSN